MTGVQPRVKRYEGDDPIGHALAQNLRTRHLTTGQKAAVAYKAEHLYAEQAEKRRREAMRGNSNASKTTVADLPPLFDPATALRGNNRAEKQTVADLPPSVSGDEPEPAAEPDVELMADCTAEATAELAAEPQPAAAHQHPARAKPQPASGISISAVTRVRAATRYFPDTNTLKSGQTYTYECVR